MRFVAELGFAFGHKLSPERAECLAECIEGWTVGQVERALTWIPRAPQLARQVSFERTIGPVLLAIAAEHPQILSGKLICYRRARKLSSIAGVPIPELFEATHVRRRDGTLETPPRWKLTSPELLEDCWTSDGYRRAR